MDKGLQATQELYKAYRDIVLKYHLTDEEALTAIHCVREVALIIMAGVSAFGVSGFNDLIETMTVEEVVREAERVLKED